jgi:hypothetical protein
MTMCLSKLQSNSQDDSTIRSPNRLLTPLKSASKKHSGRLAFPNLRLGWVKFMLPKRRFGKAEPTFQNAFPGEALFNDL